MRILYGVQGTGNGHIARARIMAAAFAQRDDFTVDFVFSGRDEDKYFDMEVFGPYRTFRGLTFITSHTYCCNDHSNCSKLFLFYD